MLWPRLLLAMGVAQMAALKCTRQVDFFSGESPQQEEECLQKEVPVHWCFNLTGWSVYNIPAPHGCAPKFVRTYCEEYEFPTKQKSDFCVNLRTNDVKGQLCCCKTDHCNAVPALKPNQKPSESV